MPSRAAGGRPIVAPVSPIHTGGEFLRNIDWSRSPLGAPETWSTQLRTTVGMMLASRAQIVLFWGDAFVALYNEAYAPTIGDKHPHALGRPAVEYWAELWDDLEPLLQGVRRSGETFFARDRPFYIERHGYGETAYFDVSYSAVPDADGSVAGVLCIVSETTRRVLNTRRQAALLDLEDRLRVAVSAEEARQAASIALGSELAASSVHYVELGESIALPYPQECESVRIALDHAGTLDIPIWREGRAVGRFAIDGQASRGWTDDEVQFARSVVERAWGAAERIRAEARLQQANRELEQRVARAMAEREEALARVHDMQKLETIGQLTGGVAHDFNNLLTPIVSALEMVGRLPAGDARIARLTGAGLQAADRARTLVRRLLAFARRQHLEARPTDVAGLVRSMEDLLARSLGPQIRLRIECGEQLLMATVDPNQLELALLNLAVNARDAMPHGGELAIGMAMESIRAHARLGDGDYVRIAVTDTGSGMDARTLQRAVEPFFTTKVQGQGTGLGLSMVHGLAAQSGGDFALDSTVGRGTTAMLWLPACIGGTDAWSEQRIAQEPTPRRVTPDRVLLVDDEELVRQGTAEMLADVGYRVRQAASAREALAILADDPEIAILVTDYAMPGMTGIELAQASARLRPALPVLLITGFVSLDATAISGMTRLAKPFRQHELIDTVAGMLASATSATGAES